LRNRKALDFLVQHANVRDEEWREEAEEEQRGEAEAGEAPAEATEGA
jgi:hypothetical protein